MDLFDVTSEAIEGNILDIGRHEEKLGEHGIRIDIVETELDKVIVSRVQDKNKLDEINRQSQDLYTKYVDLQSYVFSLEVKLKKEIDHETGERKESLENIKTRIVGIQNQFSKIDSLTTRLEIAEEVLTGVNADSFTHTQSLAGAIALVQEMRTQISKNSTDITTVQKEVVVLSDKESETEIRLTALEHDVLEKWSTSKEQIEYLTHIFTEIGLSSEDAIRILPKLFEREKLSEIVQNEISVIEQNEYQSSFYHTVQRKLNSTYIATSAIESKFVKSEQHHVTLDIISNILKVVGPHVPIAGFAVSLLGEFFEKLDIVKAREMSGHYAHLADNSSTMEKISEALARKLLLDIRNHQTETNYLDIVMSNLDDLVRDGLQATLLTKAAEGVSDGKFWTRIKSMFGRKAVVEIPSQDAKGREDAEQLADYISTAIMCGKEDIHGRTADEKVDSIISLLGLVSLAEHSDYDSHA